MRLFLTQQNTIKRTSSYPSTQNTLSSKKKVAQKKKKTNALKSVSRSVLALFGKTISFRFTFLSIGQQHVDIYDDDDDGDDAFGI